MEIQINHTTLELAEGDITTLQVDAIVNAANEYLQLGSGVAGAIRGKGGPSIQQECDLIGGCPVGDAAITGAGNLPARYVIHAVGPRVSNPHADMLLVSAVECSLALADENNLASIAFPAISTGVFGYPIDRCAERMLDTIGRYIRDHESTTLRRVIICLYGQHAYDIFAEELIRQHSE